MIPEWLAVVSDIELGVNVSYADIDSVAVLAEMGQGRTGNEV